MKENQFVKKVEVDHEDFVSVMEILNLLDPTSKEWVKVSFSAPGSLIFEFPDQYVMVCDFDKNFGAVSKKSDITVTECYDTLNEI
jgi:hypothetical protein